MKFLSPSSRQIRLKNKRQKHGKRKIKKLEDAIDKQRIILEKEQHKEVVYIVKIINDKYQEQLQKVCQESIDSNSPNTGMILQDIWHQDSHDRHEFSNDQMKNVTSSKGNTWSSVTYRLALAI